MTEESEYTGLIEFCVMEPTGQTDGREVS